MSDDRPQTLRVIGGSLDGETVPAFDPDGRPVGFVQHKRTGELWLRDRDELRLTPGASAEDSYFATVKDGDLVIERVGPPPPNDAGAAR